MDSLSNLKAISEQKLRLKSAILHHPRAVKNLDHTVTAPSPAPVKNNKTNKWFYRLPFSNDLY